MRPSTVPERPNNEGDELPSDVMFGTEYDCESVGEDELPSDVMFGTEHDVSTEEAWKT